MSNDDSDATLLLGLDEGESIPQKSDSCYDDVTPFLVISNGFEKGKKILLMSSISTMGRSPECVIPIKDNRVSSKHAELLCECSNIAIRDLGSKNGTFVNGRRREESQLQDGDRILVGSTELVISIPKR